MKEEYSDYAVHLTVESYDIENATLLLDFVDYDEYLQIISLPYPQFEEYRRMYPYYNVWGKIEQAYSEFVIDLNDELPSDEKAYILGDFLARQFERLEITDFVIPPSKIMIKNYQINETFDSSSLCGSVYAVSLPRSIFKDLEVIHDGGNNVACVVDEHDEEISLCVRQAEKLPRTKMKLEDMPSEHKLIYDMSRYCKSYEGIQKVLTLEEEIPMELVVKDVGQGNWNMLRSIYPDSQPILNFDFGSETYVSKSRYLNKAILHKRLKNGDSSSAYEEEVLGRYLVVSHWHEDHINWLRYLPVESIMNLEAIAIPEYIDVFYKDARKAHKELCKYIPDKPLSTNDVFIRLWVNNFHRLYSFPANSMVVSTNKNWAIGRCRRMTDLNRQGLVMFIRNFSNLFILTGDNSWFNIQTKLKEVDVDMLDVHTVFVVVPHHCGNAGQLKTAEKYLKSKLKYKNKIAAISVGNPNKHNHPNGEMMKFIIDLGFTVTRTDKNGDIVLF